MGKLSLLAASSILALANGCSHGLSQVMQENGFTAITPPQTGWTPGTIVEIVSGQDEFPTMRITPEAAGLGASNNIYSSDTPDFTNNHDAKFDLAVGATIPAPIKAELNVKFSTATKYSVKCGGNKIYRILIDEYAARVFGGANGLSARYGGNWGVPLGRNELYYLNELWCSASLEYNFYDSGNVDVTTRIPVSTLAANLAPGYSWSSNGTLKYTSSTGQLVCLGYKARPIVRSTTNPNQIVLHSTGSAATTVATPGAHAEKWDPKPPQ